jgi:CubicO group peptidase (beta-lactamase class C family)
MRPLPSLAVSCAALAMPALLGAQGPTTLLDRRIDSVFTAFSRTATPGCAVGVDQRGTPLVRRAYGMANLETGTPFTTSTISESGSTAKQFVAAGLVMLARDGVLTLDDDITRWVPEAKGFGKRITIRHLLSHTSGIPDRYLLHDVQGRAAGDVDHTNAEVLDIVSKLRDLNFDPGEDYLYSNTGYVVAVAVLERASGKSLQQFSQERIFTPLGMTHTRWREDHRVVVPNRASAYAGSVARGFVNEHPFTRVFGSGGLLLTIGDFLTWSNALQTGVGAWGAIRDSLEAVIRLNDRTAITYGLGVSSEQWRGVRVVSHTGATGGYRASLFRYPAQVVSIAILCNGASANTTALNNSVAAIVLGDALQPAVAQSTTGVPLSAEALTPLVGRYHAPRTDEAVVLELRNGQLTDSLSGASLLPVSPDLFRVRGADAWLRVHRAPNGVTLVDSASNTRTTEYLRVADPLPSRVEYVGHFSSPELSADLILAMRGDTLVIDRGVRGTLALSPIYRDGFESAEGRVRFTRDARGRVSGLTIWAGRVRHLRFVKRATVR